MDKQPPTQVALYLGVALLLLPVLYVLSYFVLVLPGRSNQNGHDYLADRRPINYRVGERTAERVFWPLEQIDRKVRRKAWESWEPGFRIVPRIRNS